MAALVFPVLAASEVVQAFGQPTPGSIWTWLWMAAMFAGLIAFTGWCIWISRDREPID